MKLNKLFKIGTGVFAKAEFTSLDSSLYELLRLEGQWVLFCNLYVHPFIRGKGYSHRILKLATQYADRHKIGLVLQVNPYSTYGYRLNTLELIQLYQQYGFRPSGSNLMIRRLT